MLVYRRIEACVEVTDLEFESGNVRLERESRYPPCFPSEYLSSMLQVANINTAYYVALPGHQLIQHKTDTVLLKSRCTTHLICLQTRFDHHVASLMIEFMHTHTLELKFFIRMQAVVQRVLTMLPSSFQVRFCACQFDTLRKKRWRRFIVS
jgi:hypothetical protein